MKSLHVTGQQHHASSGSLSDRSHHRRISPHRAVAIAPTQQPLPSLSTSSSASHFPAAAELPLMPSHTHTITVTHPRFVRLLAQEAAATNHSNEVESKRETSPNAPIRRKEPINLLPISIPIPHPPTKLDVHKIEHFDAVQQQVQQMVRKTA